MRASKLTRSTAASPFTAHLVSRSVYGLAAAFRRVPWAAAGLRAIALAVPVLLVTVPVHAQVTSGTTEVTKEGFQEPGAVDPPEETDETEAALQGGGLLAGGNARSFAVTGSGRFLIRRDAHQFGATAAMNYATSAQDATSNLEPTVENYQGKARYDYFISNRLSAFLAVQGRHDPFQGLRLRMSIDPGLAYYFVKNGSTTLWGEAGYDFQYDILTDETLAQAEADGEPRDQTETDHNARLFAGYDQSLKDRLTLATGLEFLKSFAIAESWRLNWKAELQTQLIDDLSFAVGTLMMFNNTPLPGVEKLDVITSLSFVYTLL